MTFTITENNDGSTCIEVDFNDEGVELVARTRVIGNENKARGYLPYFENDLRTNNRHLFPDPEPVEDEELYEESE